MKEAAAASQGSSEIPRLPENGGGSSGSVADGNGAMSDVHPRTVAIPTRAYESTASATHHGRIAYCREALQDMRPLDMDSPPPSAQVRNQFTSEAHP